MSGPNGVVHLLRHGEVFNPHKLLYGRMPGFVLSTAGERMAVQAADALEGRDIVAVISSPLTRAQQTATPLAERLGLPIITDERLVEPWNVFEGLTVGVGDGSLRQPRYWRHLINPFRPSWGEPYVEVVARMNGAVLAAAERAQGHEVVCVSHQLPIWITRRAADGRRLWHRPDRRQCALASVTSLTVRDGSIVRVDYSEPAEPVAASGPAGA
jgi:broad specificity phosphatase PhoE